VEVLSGYFGKIRASCAEVKTKNGQASGAVHIMNTLNLWGCGKSGICAPWTVSPIPSRRNPDIAEFLEIGTEGNPIQEFDPWRYCY